ncbi:cobalamin-independent methionine synthase II family protein [Halobacterium noricense]|uniref:cobalamin-independent methionine synthase II family protein n=1 Tax=Halobacterium noricense TaxID=223182 RepID=UPI001E469E2A|nr:cobalamin-independent methionine synthase II family protein [Halobacterium noricense]UHH24734.1 cobalamin-independent methionine synthase II family protein [Halobacterium noricense]
MSDDHISTTHIGSLPRDPELLDLLQRRQDGENVDPDQWHQTVQDATESVVRKQADVGLDVVNNGEQPRVSFNWYVANRLSGIGGERDAPLWDDLADFPEYASDAFDTETIDLTKQPSVTGPVEYDGTAAVDEEIETFADALDAVDADFEGTFLTAASPGVAAATLVNEHYDSHEEFVHAVGDALREEYEAIADTGAILHLDAPDLLTTGHRGFGDRPVEKLKPIVRLHVAALNEATRNIPDDQIRVHTCWGSYEGPHHRDTPLVDVFPELYELDVGGLSIEEANPRHEHEYRVFAEHPLPDGWDLLPGVVDVKTNVVEHPDVVADRIERVADAVGDPTRIVAAPDCGFDTQAGLAMVHPEIAWKKLEALVDGAAVATDRLF